MFIFNVFVESFGSTQKHSTHINIHVVIRLAFVCVCRSVCVLEAYIYLRESAVVILDWITQTFCNRKFLKKNLLIDSIVSYNRNMLQKNEVLLHIG